MSKQTSKELLSKVQGSMIGHGALIMFISLVAGIMLTFDMLEGFKIWPFLDIAVDIPGSVRGWKAAHVGGLLNAVMILVVALCVSKVTLSVKSLNFIHWSFILTGWGNTVFYWAGNIAMNRGLAVGATPYGEGDFYGAIAFLSAASIMFFTMLGCLILMKAGFQLSSSSE